MKKKTILSIMDSLEKINDSVIKSLEAGAQVAMETLVDCQDSAIAVGNEIEQYYGAVGEETVHLLEAYCENLYQMSSRPDDFSFCRKHAKKIQKQLGQIRNHVKYDLPEDKKEIVFLPYKASMWDSLESVWKAADADPDCDAYVIPIPYFDKNPDGSFREEHYEGDQYPKYVPITRYDEYDLKARRPDVIYIHNPYDECNHVTSVHPYFYSKNLRNYTDKLVYIPYFILNEIDPDNQAAIDGMKHFCFTPGTIYAHQVIVQSENMRQIYINEYMKAAKEMGLSGEHVNRRFLEKKFLGTGSPKVDKVLNTRKEDLEIPAEWLRIIEKPDGSWKKIVFYNISVSSILHNDEKMLRKMESVFQIFRENRDEVALLWRPHPLIQATIESMRPQLWEEYREIRDRYIEEGWGIYDDTADVDRAVVISDAYYGSMSSVVQLCQKAGMPVMIQDVKALDQYDDMLLFNSLYVEKQQAFFVSTYFWQESLFKIDLESGEIFDLSELSVKSEEEDSFSLVCGDDDVITIMPYLNLNCVIQYDRGKNKIQLVESVGRIKEGNIRFPKCTNSIRFDNSIFFVMNGINLIFEYHCKERRYFTHELCMQDKVASEEWLFYWNAYAQIGNKVYLPLKNSGKIMELTLPNCSAKIVKEFVDCNIQKISYLNGYMWLMPLKGNQLIRWDINTDKLKTIEFVVEREKENFFEGIYQICGLLVAMVNCAPGFYIINEEKFALQRVDTSKYGIEESILGEDSNFTVVSENEEFVFYIVNELSDLIRINKQNGEIRKYDLNVNIDKVKKLNICGLENRIYRESHGLSLRNYMKFMQK